MRHASEMPRSLMTRDQADEIILESKYGDDVDDQWTAPDWKYAYGLTDGSVVLVDAETGEMEHRAPDDIDDTYAGSA